MLNVDGCMFNTISYFTKKLTYYTTYENHNCIVSKNRLYGLVLLTTIGIANFAKKIKQSVYTF